MSTYDPYWNNVTLLCNFDNGYTDSAKNHQFVPIGDSYVGTSAAQYKSGGSSLLSTSRAYGQAGYVRCTDVNSDFHFQGEMTIEFFFYTPDLVTNGSILGFGNNLIYGGTALNTNRVAVAIYNNNIFLYLDHGTPTAIFNSITLYNNLILANSWNHIAITRDSSNIVRLFANGQLSQPNPLLANPSVSNPYNRDMIEYIDSFCIGSMELYGTTILGAGGYIDSVRITKGICRYSEPFTPPTGDFDQFPKQLIIEDSSGNIVHTKSLEGLTSGTYKLPYSIGASTWEGKLKVYTTGMYPNLTKIMDVSCISNDNCDPYWDNVVLAMHMDGVPPGAYNVVSGTYTPPGIYNSVEDIRVQVTNFIRNANGCQPSADWSGCPTISGSSQLIPVIYDNSDGTGTINFTGYYGGGLPSVSYNNNIFIDEKGNTFTNYGAILETIARFNSGMNGGTGYLRLTNPINLLSTNSWTIECFAKDIGNNNSLYIEAYNSAITIVHCGKYLFAQKVRNGADNPILITSAINFNDYIHIAIVYSVGTLRVFANGLPVGLASVTVSFSFGEIAGSGGLNFGTNQGMLIDDLRITNGIARYTGNFIPPTKAFPDIKCEPPTDTSTICGIFGPTTWEPSV
jgi:hypothetical protein